MEHFNKCTQGTCVMIYELHGNTSVISFHGSLRFLQYCAGNNTTVQTRLETAVNYS